MASSPWDFNGFEDMGWVSKFLGESRVLYEDDGTIWYGHCTMNYERLVSYGGLRIFQLADSKKEGLLHSDCVNREYRGRGLHRSLIKVREKRAVDLEVSVLYASVHPKNTPCISNLEKMGFKLRSKVEKKVDKRVERTLTYFKDIG